VSGGSWTHVLARAAVRPLLGTFVTPNHLTTLRLLTGLAACGVFAWGTGAAVAWGGVLWLLSAFLDRADGELARIGNMRSPGGHLYDYYSDNLITALFFVAIGIGMRSGWLGDWSMPLGVLAGGSLAALNWASEQVEKLGPPGTVVLAGGGGFDPDDAFYLMAPFAWLGWLSGILLAAAIVTPVVATVVGLRLLRMRRSAVGIRDADA
jgi:phosphatidylglycerophosphate synthase